MDEKRRFLLKAVFGTLSSLLVVRPSLAGIGSSEFVNLTNMIISREYGAIVQYINHSGVAEGSLAAVFLENMEDEVIHARELTRILLREGATPALAVWPPKSAREPSKLIKEDLEMERALIELYQKLLSLPEAAKHKDLLNSFLQDELRHRERLLKLLSSLS
jgi:bacterioferritin